MPRLICLKASSGLVRTSNVSDLILCLWSSTHFSPICGLSLVSVADLHYRSAKINFAGTQYEIHSLRGMFQSRHFFAICVTISLRRESRNKCGNVKVECKMLELIAKVETGALKCEKLRIVDVINNRWKIVG